MLIPATAIVPTCDRAASLRRTLESLARQSAQPATILVVDASARDDTRAACEEAGGIAGLDSRVEWVRATSRGAANQRNEGFRRATAEPLVFFFDDDVLFEPECVARLHAAIEADARLGAVNAMITNQRYVPPGRASAAMFRFLAGEWLPSYAGRVIGPAVNLLPEDRDDLPAVVVTDWLNTTCTLYRREAMPDPPFPPVFEGYSMCEDLTLSLLMGRKWKLANARTARILHDSQPGLHKASLRALARMELINRYYVMTRIMGRRRVADHLKLMAWELFGVVAGARMEAHPVRALAAQCAGKMGAIAHLLTRGAPGGRP